MNPATKVVRGTLVDGLGRVALLDPALVHDRDPVRHRQRLLLVVGHVDERDPDVALDPLQLQLQALAQLQVERTERLVEQQHLGQVDQRPGERDPLLHPARELRRALVLPLGQPDPLELGGDAALDLGLVDPLALQSVADVLGDGHVGEQGVALEDRVGRPLVRRQAGDVDALDLHPPALGCSNPAIIRRVVVLPQPEGPSKVKNSPWAISRSTSRTATNSSKLFVTCSSRTLAWPGSRFAPRSPLRALDGQANGAARGGASGKSPKTSNAACSDRTKKIAEIDPLPGCLPSFGRLPLYGTERANGPDVVGGRDGEHGHGCRGGHRASSRNVPSATCGCTSAAWGPMRTTTCRSSPAARVPTSTTSTASAISTGSRRCSASTPATAVPSSPRRRRGRSPSSTSTSSGAMPTRARSSSLSGSRS